MTPALGRLRPQNWGRQATPVLGPRFYTIVSIFRRKLVQVLGGSLLCKSATWTSSRTLMRPIRPVHHAPCCAQTRDAISGAVPKRRGRTSSGSKARLDIVKAPGDPRPMRALEQQPATQFRNSIVSVALPQNLGSPGDPKIEAAF